MSKNRRDEENKMKFKQFTLAVLACTVAWQFSFAEVAKAEFDYRAYEYGVDEYSDSDDNNYSNASADVIDNTSDEIAIEEKYSDEVNENNYAENNYTNDYSEKITDIRYSKSEDKVRIVFNLPTNVYYDIKQNDNGYIVIDFSRPIDDEYLNGIEIGDETVPFAEVYSDDSMSCVVLQIANDSAYSYGELNNPRRLYVDVDKSYAYSVTKDLEAGLTQISYYSKQGSTKQTAYLVDIDPAYFKLVPVLGGGNVMAKNTVRAMSDYVNASVAENASYFGAGKELYGVTKIAGDLISSMYLTRGAFGVLEDGTPYIGEVSYSGIVHSDYGDLYVSGLNGTRSSEGVMLYNKYYGKTTGTNDSGREYTVKDNRVISIQNGNSPLKDDEIVVSVTGEANKNLLSNVQVGDVLEVEQILNNPWDTATDILGVGPRLVKDGQVNVTSSVEQIGADVTGARAPRTAVGILRNGHVLFAVLDGRQAHSRGMMLDEFARFLIDMDVVDAVNFDGGGSSELVVNGKIVNSPSDGMERPVATVLSAVRR